MPMVNGKEFSYSKKGMAMAKKEAKKSGKKMVMRKPAKKMTMKKMGKKK
jgi:aminoglycoside phosphotransferase (APT) family kinase protein